MLNYKIIKKMWFAKDNTSLIIYFIVSLIIVMVQVHRTSNIGREQIQEEALFKLRKCANIRFKI